jgi:catechol 2,3-dioxygenase
MQRYGSGAIFVSAGGYHHHIGLNTWAGVGAPPPPPDATGLRWFEVLLPGAEELEAIKASLKAAGVLFEEQEGGVLLKDPSQNTLILKTR